MVPREDAGKVLQLSSITGLRHIKGFPGPNNWEGWNQALNSIRILGQDLLRSGLSNQ